MQMFHGLGLRACTTSIRFVKVHYEVVGMGCVCVCLIVGSVRMNGRGQRPMESHGKICQRLCTFDELKIHFPSIGWCTKATLVFTGTNCVRSGGIPLCWYFSNDHSSNILHRQKNLALAISNGIIMPTKLLTD